MREYGAITFEAFINLLVGITEDQMSLDQLREAFQGVAGDKVRCTLLSSSLSTSLTSFTQPYVTELDLRLAHIPASGIEFLREAMPSIPNEVGEPQYDFAGWLDSVFE